MKKVSLVSNIPGLLAVWEDSCEYVHISNDLIKMLGGNECVLEPYVFSKLISKHFGNFLGVASEKVHSLGEYSENIGKHKVTLKLNQDTYTMIVTPLKKTILSENILDMLPIYVWQRNTNLKITFCNKKYADALETTVDDVIENNIKLQVELQKNSREVSPEQMAVTYRKPQTVEEHVIISGDRRLLRFTELPIIANSYQVGFAIDITDEESIENEYELYKTQTAEIFNHISIPIAVFNSDTRLSFANNAVLKLFEFDENYALSEPLCTQVIDRLIDERKIMDVEDSSKFKERINKYFREIIVPYYTSINTPDGKTLNTVIAPHYGGGLVFVFDDITEKINLEREYNALSAVQRETLDHLHEGILVFGTDNRIKMTNPAINDLWDKDNSGRFIDIHVAEFFKDSANLFRSVEDYEFWLSKIVNISSQRTNTSGIINLKNGRNIDYAYVPLPDGLNLIRFVDVTDRQKLETALREKAAIVSQIDRLKTSFIAGMSYELQSPLKTIAGFADILLNQYFGELNIKQNEYCNGILSAVNRLSEIIEAMLNLASIEAGQMKIKYKEIKIKDFIDTCVNLLTDVAKKRDITFEIGHEKEDVTAYIDEKSMKQVVFQILLMGIKTTRIAGTIKIASKFCDNNKSIEISIRDNGVGMSSDEVEKKRMMLAKGSEEQSFGTIADFELAFVNSVVKLHNGRMLINSEQNVGTEINIIVPLKPLHSSYVSGSS